MSQMPHLQIINKASKQPDKKNRYLDDTMDGTILDGTTQYLTWMIHYWAEKDGQKFLQQSAWQRTAKIQLQNKKIGAAPSGAKESVGRA